MFLHNLLFTYSKCLLHIRSWWGKKENFYRSSYTLSLGGHVCLSNLAFPLKPSKLWASQAAQSLALVLPRYGPMQVQ